MAQRDYYEILGVKRGTGDDDIRSAYRRLARKYHPDLNPGDADAERRFKELGEAYEVLSNPEKRKRYDQFGHAGVHAGPGPGPGGFRYTWTGEGSPFEGVDFEAFGAGRPDLGSIFEGLFGRMGRRPGRRAPRPAARGRDLETELAIPLADVARGAQARLNLQVPTDGGAARPQTLTLKVPPGVRDGQRLRLRGKGAPGPAGAPPGDLYVRVRHAPHPLFRSSGTDVTIDLPITVAEAALGATVDVPTLHGKTAVRIPPGTAGGKRLRLKGQGLPDAHGGPKGDQYCLVHIVPPTGLDDDAKRLFEEIRRREKGSPRSGPGWTS